MIYFHGSGIGLLLSTIVFGQAPMPKNLTLQQVVANRLQQHRQWNLRELPRHTVQYSSLSPASSHFSGRAGQRSVPSTVPVSKTYGQPPTQPTQPSATLQSYPVRDRIQHSINQRQWWRHPNNGPGSTLRRSILAQPAPPPH